jgi:proteasome lid subunit RPN8/RPN11
VVVPPAVRSALVEHSEAESPNEACGVVVFKDGEAERYIPGTNLSESPYRYELQVPPDTWFLEDEGKPYLILSLRTGELAGWRIVDGRIEPEEVS